MPHSWPRFSLPIIPAYFRPVSKMNRPAFSQLKDRIALQLWSNLVKHGLITTSTFDTQHRKSRPQFQPRLYPMFETRADQLHNRPSSIRHGLM
jgi:hypothetical protein